MKWLTETLYPDIRISLRGKLVYQEKTPEQDMAIYRTERFGNTLVLDGAIQTTEKDEFIYHEMLTHPVMLIHPAPRKILIIGGGDGGALREVLKHPVDEVYLVEIDKYVIDFSKKHLKTICRNAFSNRRVKIVIDDGAKFVAKTGIKFDVVIIDSPDPIGPAKVLFSKRFYKNVYNVLGKQGLMIRQSGSTFLQRNVLQSCYRMIKSVFPYTTVQLAAIPTYIGGFFSFVIGSKRISPQKININSITKKMDKYKIKTLYYTPEVHLGSISLPPYVRRLVQ